MTATFDPDTRQTLASADEIDIETSRSPGGPLHRVTIWIVVDDDTAYVRSVRGPAGRWHRDLLANPSGGIDVAGRRLAITAYPVDDAETISQVSAALKRKYEQRWPGPLAGMLRVEVLPTTMRLEPA